MKSFVYADNSNVYIEGCRVSAVRRGLPGAASIGEAQRNGVVDHTWNIDYGRLYEFACGTNKSEVGCANLWGSPPPGDSFWEMVERKGWKHKTYQKNVQGKEKMVDVAIATSVTKDAFTIIDKANDEIVLISGDNDFVPAVEMLRNEGFRVVILFWDHAGAALKQAASEFISLDKYFDHLSRKTA